MRSLRAAVDRVLELACDTVPAPELARLEAELEVQRRRLDAAEARVIGALAAQDPATLRRSGELLLGRLDPDGRTPDDAEVERRRAFGLRRRADGTAAPYGTLTEENLAVWQTIFNSLAAPQRADGDVPDPRSSPQRIHDALLEAGLRLLRSGTLPDTGGVPASVVIRVDADDLATTVRGEPGGIAQTAHDRTFDAAGWRVDMIDGVPQWTPPAWLDPDRRPRRNTAHHLPEISFAGTVATR